MLQLDFRSDWQGYVTSELVNYGLAYEPTQSLADNTLTYFNAKRRWVPPARRTVHQSAELKIPAGLSSQYQILRHEIESGQDLNLYLSRTITEGDFTDSLLNDWGLHHLHFEKRPKRTGYVLFVRFSDTEAYLVQADLHGKGNPHVWVDVDFVQIMHDNWPDMMAPARLIGISGNPLSPNQRTTLRRKHGNAAVSVSDGTCYGPLGSGLTSSGYAISDVMDYDKISAKLADWESLVKANEGNFRRAAGVADSDLLMVKLVIDSGGCWMYEPTRGIRFNLEGISGIA